MLFHTFYAELNDGIHDRFAFVWASRSRFFANRSLRALELEEPVCAVQPSTKEFLGHEKPVLALLYRITVSILNAYSNHTCDRETYHVVKFALLYGSG